MARWFGAVFVFLGLASVVAVAAVYRQDGARLLTDHAATSRGLVTKADLASVLGGAGRFQDLPAEIQLKVNGKPEHVVVQYSFDARLQETMKGLFDSYDPDYGALVAMDAVTGRVLAMISYTHDETLTDNLALRASFPSASVFKVVTAAAAIAERRFSVDTVIPFNGRNHTLYRGNVFKNPINRWTHYITLKDAFARSINTVFARIGAYSVGAAELREYAGRFGFNRTIASDVPIEVGHAPIPDDTWSVAEAASGYTRDNTMSPLQGALIAATVANDGTMMEPFVVQSVHSMDGNNIYSAEPKVASKAVDAGTAAEVRTLMKETIIHGTSRHSFKGFFRGEFAGLEVGGKTGSLTGMDPKGKYDWFIGFAGQGSDRIAIAALTVHKKYWKVKSSYLARRAIERYFHDRRQDTLVAAATTQTAPVRAVR